MQFEGLRACRRSRPTTRHPSGAPLALRRVAHTNALFTALPPDSPAISAPPRPQTALCGHRTHPSAGRLALVRLSTRLRPSDRLVLHPRLRRSLRSLAAWLPPLAVLPPAPFVLPSLPSPKVLLVSPLGWSPRRSKPGRRVVTTRGAAKERGTNRQVGPDMSSRTSSVCIGCGIGQHHERPLTLGYRRYQLGYRLGGYGGVRDVIRRPA